MSLFSAGKGKRPDVKRALVEAPAIPEIVHQEPPRPHQERSPRKNTWSVCTISNDGEGGREAVIVDVSRTGARVRFQGRGSLPSVVHIKSSRLGLNRKARVIWQDNCDVGLRFIPPGKS